MAASADDPVPNERQGNHQRKRATVGSPIHSKTKAGPVDPQRLNAAGSVYLTRPLRSHFNRTYEEFAWRAGELFDAITAGTVSITTGEQYHLKDAAQAQRDLEARRTHLSTILTP